MFCLSYFAAIPAQRFGEFVGTAGISPCFGDPPLPSALPLPGADDDLFSPTTVNGDLSPSCCPADLSPTFDKPYLGEMEKTIEGSRFIAQHMKNKDKFESVSKNKNKTITKRVIVIELAFSSH